MGSTKAQWLSHVAVSVPVGMLDDQFRDRVRGFYGDAFEWREIDELRLPDRLTLAVGDRCYLNIREREEPMTCSGYEHVGVAMSSPEAVDALWARLRATDDDLELSELKRGNDGYRSFRFRHLLPMAIEVQHFP